MDETLDKIAIMRKHLNLLKKLKDLKDKLVKLDRQRDEIIQSLGEIDEKLVYNNLSLQKINNYPVRVLRRKD